MEKKLEINLEELEKGPAGNPYVAKFQAFFETVYKKKIERTVAGYPEQRSLNIDINELGRFDPILESELLEKPDALIEAAEKAIETVEVPALEIEEFKPFIRFYNHPEKELLIKDIGAQHLGKLISVEGLVRQITDVLPKIQIAFWECRKCSATYRIFQDSQQVKGPNICESCRGREFAMIQEQSEFIDCQKIQIQEPLEKLKGSEQASSLDVHVANDLVNRITAGDTTRFVGMLRIYPAKEKKVVYGRFLEALHLEETAREFEELEISPEEEKTIKELSTNPKIYEMLAKSIAPAIYGHETVKEAIVMQLFGGVRKILPSNPPIRGNVHILLVGEPGCLVADERIVLGNGAIVKIGGIAKEHLQNIDLQVLTGEGGAKRDRANVFHYYKNQQVMEIITESGKSIKGTPNHPVLCLTQTYPTKRFWKRLDEIKIRDKVATVTGIPCTITKYIPTGFKTLDRRLGPRFKGNLPDKVTPELAELMGYVLGDGWTRKYEVGFVVAEPEKDILEPLLEKCKKLFGIKAHVSTRLIKEERRKVPLHYATINSLDVAQNLMFLREKRIPDLILQSGNKVAAAFLKWLFEADGCVFNNGRGRRGISFKAKNIEFLRDIQILLLRFGTHSRVVGNNLFIRRGKEIKKFAKKIGFVSQKKTEKLRKLALDAEKFGQFKGQRTERIKKIICHGTEDVFDIEVPKTHRFIANGIISHNTGKSQLLQATHAISPKSIYFAGKTTTGVGLCVAPDTLILNNNGFREIKDFVEENFDEARAREELKGAFSNDFSGKTQALNHNLKINHSDVYKIWRINAPEKMIKLRTQSGKEIELTPNTSLIRIKNGIIEWVASQDIDEQDFVATARALPEGTIAKYPTIKILWKNKNIRIRDNVFEKFREITDTLAKKHGSVQNIAKNLKLPRETFYLWRTEKFSSGIPLNAFVKLGLEAGCSFDELSDHVNEIFLRYGKNIKIPRYLDDEKLAYLVGLALGDGNIYQRKNSASIRIFSASSQILESVDRNVKELFGIDTEKINDGKRVPNRRFASIPIYEIMKAFGAAKEKRKIRISHLASEFPNKTLSKIIQGLFDTDGYVSKTEKGPSHVGLTTISRSLARSVQLCLLKFGVHAKLRLRKKAGTISHGREITVKSNYGQYCIELRGKGNLEKFEKNICFNLERKKNALRQIISSISKANTNMDTIPEISSLLKECKTDWNYSSGRIKPTQNKLKELIKNKNNKLLGLLSEADIKWEQVLSKENFKPAYEFVYDYSVKDSHNFIANGIFVHNTATAVKDEFGEGGWTLKAGALVLASGGSCMADELDKLDPEERSAMHEAMEQGMISVAKAGIVTRFKADTSILAASNPKFSRFDPYSPIIEQINLPLSLMSRFDL